MITAVAVTPDAIRNPSGQYVDGAHRHLRDLLRSHAFLVFTEEEDYARCKEAVKQLPFHGVERTQWLELLLRLEKFFIRRPPRPLAELVELATVRDWEGRAALLLVAPDHFAKLDVRSTDKRVIVASGVEVAHAELVHLTQSIGELSRKAQITIRSKEFPDAPDSREKLWEQWIAPLARAHVEITIVDPYLGKNIANQAFRHGFRDKKRDELAELPWLLSKIAASAPRGSDDSPLVSLKLLTAAETGSHDAVSDVTGAPLTRERIADALSDLVAFLDREGVPIFGADRGIRKIELQTYSNDLREHPRHIRFTNSTPGRKGFHRFLRLEGGIDALRYEDLSTARVGQLKGSWDLTYRVGSKPSLDHGDARDEARLVARSTTSPIRLDLSDLLRRNGDD
jgi:hypothetical protein